ncbi:MAG TPA: MFS transporter [Candidatus Korarchaeota archaeon]|nr:MFS transporter [Candidatus Korarchaeota archaeon]
MEGKKRGLRNVIALGFVSFFTDISTEMILGVLPTFIVEELGAGKAILGLIDGIADVLNYIFRIISGFISDKLGVRKIVVFAGYAISTFAKPGFALVKSWPQALAIRITDRVGKGVRTSARDALLAESVDEKSLGKAFGLHRTLDQMGAILGPGLAALLLPLIGVRGIFLSSFIPGLIALLVLIFFVKERKISKRRREGIMRNVHAVLTSDFLLFLIAVGLFSIGAYSPSFVLVRSKDLGVMRAAIPLVYASINVMHSLIAIPAGVLSDKIGGAKTISLGYLLFCLASLTLTAVSGIHIVILASFLFGSYVGIIETVQRAIVAKFGHSDLRGTAYGLYYVTVGLCSIIANVIFGLLWDIVGFRAAFTYSTVTSLIGFAAMIVFTSRFGY